MESDENLVNDVNAALTSTNAETSALEKQAHAIAQANSATQTEIVRHCIEQIHRSSSRIAACLIAWLLVYKVVDPLQVLQIIIVTKDRSILTICGTTRFEPDVIEHLKLPIEPGKQPQFEVSKQPTKVSIDLVDAIFATRGRSMPQPYESNELPASEPASTPVKKIKHDFKEYEVRVHRILKASMSAEEAVHKLTRAYIKSTEQVTAGTILRVVIEPKVYNRLYGSIALKLYLTNSKLWGKAWQDVFVQFYTADCEEVDADRLKVVGAFFGDLLKNNVLEWSNSFSAITLDVEHSSASKRILFLSIVDELRVSIGVAQVEAKLLDPSISSKLKGVLSSELAAGFWDLAGFPKIAGFAAGSTPDGTD